MLETINNFVEPYINQGLTVFGNFPYYIQAAILLGLAIFTIVGLFVFIKKFIKLFIFLALLGAAFYFISTQTDLLPNYFSTILTTSIPLLIF